MLKIKVKDKDYNLKFTFNSFKHMKNVEYPNISLDNDKNIIKPFAMVEFISDLFYGAMNCYVDKPFTRTECDEILETYIENTDFNVFAQELIQELNDSGFFKNVAVKSEMITTDKQQTPRKKKA